MAEADETYDEIEAEVRKVAMSIPPSDLGSTRGIQAVAQYVYDKLKMVRMREQARKGNT